MTPPFPRAVALPRMLPCDARRRLNATNPGHRSSKQRFDPGEDDRGSGERREQRGLCQLFARRQPGELALDDVEFALDRIEIGTGLIGPLQRQRVFIGHAPVMPEQSCSMVITRRPSRAEA
jgi:hypothetical protein